MYVVVLYQTERQRAPACNLGPACLDKDIRSGGSAHIYLQTTCNRKHKTQQEQFQ